MKSISFILVFFISGSIFGQVFTGIVKDADSSQPIPYVSIFLRELDSGTYSDENGEFTIDHYPEKPIHIQVSAVGYESIDVMVDLKYQHLMTFLLTKSHIDLQEVVISAPSGKLQGENVVGIDRRKIEILSLNPKNSLAEAISLIPGVHIKSSGIGIGKPIIRGLSGNRVVVFSQGIRMENQQWGDEHGLGTGSIGIEAVEVIKGPASLLYGSDALGGVLYLVDERYAQHNTMEGYVESKFMGNSTGTSNSAGFKIHKGSFKWNVFGGWTSHFDYRIPAGEWVDNTRFNEKNIKTSLGFNINHWITNFRFGYLKENFGISEGLLLEDAEERKLEEPRQSLSTYNASWENTFFTGDSRINLILGFTDNDRKEFEGDHGHGSEHSDEPTLEMDLQTYTANVKWHSKEINDKVSIIVGSQGLVQNNTNLGEEILIPDATTIDFGAFTILNLDLDQLQIQGGLRADHRSISTKETTSHETLFPELTRDYSSFNFSAGANWKFGNSSLRFNTSSGFRAPNSSELLSNGVHHGTNRYERGNSDLKSERATQIDLTWDITSKHLRFTISPFYNLVRNYIFLQPTGEIVEEAPEYLYQQTKATLFGSELGFHYHPHRVHWLHFESNFSTVFARDNNKNPLPLIPAAKIHTTLSADFSMLKINTVNQKVFIEHLYSFSQERTALNEISSPDYNLTNLGLSSEFTISGQEIEFSAGAKNIFNQEYIDHLSRFKSLDIPNQGRNVYVGLKINFSKKMDQN